MIRHSDFQRSMAQLNSFSYLIYCHCCKGVPGARFGCLFAVCETRGAAVPTEMLQITVLWKGYLFYRLDVTCSSFEPKRISSQSTERVIAS